MHVGPSRIYRHGVLCLALSVAGSGCTPQKEINPAGPTEHRQKAWAATKSNIMGLYHSDRGMGGWGGTCELLFGTYIIKDQMLTNGRMIGEYSLSGDEITFYNDGSTLGVAIVSEGSLNFGPNNCTYTKK